MTHERSDSSPPEERDFSGGQGTRPAAPSSLVGKVLAGVGDEVEAAVRLGEDIDPNVVNAIVQDFYDVQQEAVKRLILPADYERQGYFNNRFLLFDRMMREKYPLVLADPAKANGLRLFLLEKCGLKVTKK